MSNLEMSTDGSKQTIPSHTHTHTHTHKHTHTKKTHTKTITTTKHKTTKKNSFLTYTATSCVLYINIL